MKPQSQSRDNNGLMVSENETGSSALVAEVPVSALAGSGTEAGTVDDQREDLTVFFTIGVVVDVLLVMAFLAWAVGQWRKTKK